MKEGLRPVDLARGMFRFSYLCMYPTSRMIDIFLMEAFKTPHGLDGDAIVGHIEEEDDFTRLWIPVNAFQYLCMNNVSCTYINILGPSLSQANSQFVQRKFNDFTKYGYQNNN